MQAQQRFLKSHPCPICGGWDDQTRGKGERCWGFVSGDGKYAHCMRPEYAGTLPINLKSQGYPHRLTGNCGCGVRHDPEPVRPRGRPRKEETGTVAKIVATYDYTDPDGKVLYQAVRYEPKTFKQRRPNGNGGWIGNLNGVFKVPYQVPDLVAAPEGATVFIVEGEKDVDNLRALGMVATCNAMGAGKWEPQFGAWLIDKHVVILPDNDQAGQDHANKVARLLMENGRITSIKVVDLPDLPEKGDVSDWLADGGTVESLNILVAATPIWRDPDLPPELEPRTLDQVHEVFQRWLYMPDTGALDVALATYAANRDTGNPIWLLLIAVPGGGKTEVLSAFNKLKCVKTVGSLNAPGLLSGTAQRERAKGTKGGLLKEIGAYGVLILKDFGSVLSMHQDARSELLAALREIYDGAWQRQVGSDGGQDLSWSGKIGLIGGSTPAIDQYHAVMAALGERFILYRYPELTDDFQQRLARRALQLHGVEVNMRAELSEAVAALFQEHDDVPPLLDLSPEETDYLVTLAQFAVDARAAVQRETYSSRAIESIPGAEGATRITIVLSKLLAGLRYIGVCSERSWELLRKVALDSMPQLRRRSFELLAAERGPLSTSYIAHALNHPTTTTRRTLEDLEAYLLLTRTSQGEGKADLWELTPRALAFWTTLGTIPEKSTRDDVYSGSTVTETVPEKSTHHIWDAENNRGSISINKSPNTPLVDFSGTPSLVVGERVYPLNASGGRDTDTPVTITAITTGDDGQLWAEFAEIPGGWPLSQCERVPGEEGSNQ